MSRYDKSYDFDFSQVTKKRPPPRQENDPLADMLRLAGGLAPAAGTAIGAGIGSMAGGVGALPGAAIGGAIGAGAGGLANYGADMAERDEQDAAKRQQAEDEERAAQHRMALSMLGGF